jgi:hypothetical protein
VVLGNFGSPHGSISYSDIEDISTRRALEELDNALTNIEEAIRKMTLVQPFRIIQYTAATLPTPASDYTGCIIYVSDGAPSTRFRGSNGTSWVTLG